MHEIAFEFYSKYEELVVVRGGKMRDACAPEWQPKKVATKAQSSGVAHVTRDGAGSLQNLLQIIQKN